jgi:hypothetical protein
MSHGRMWTYPELKFVIANQFKLGGEELAAQLNHRFHGGEGIRTALDVAKVCKSKNIFNKEKNRGRGQ